MAFHWLSLAFSLFQTSSFPQPLPPSSVTLPTTPNLLPDNVSSLAQQLSKTIMADEEMFE
jgi:hypothetical protein